MKTLLTTTALVALLSAGPALAQSDNEPMTQEPPATQEMAPDAGMTAEPPAATGEVAPDATAPEVAPDQNLTDTETMAPETDADTMATDQDAVAPDVASTDEVYISEQATEEDLASNWIGQSLYNGSDENLGDINDILLDKDGRVRAVIVGVGGFLGIGEKDVAIPFQSLEFTSRQAMSGTAGTGASGTGTTGTGSTGTAGSAGTDRPATTASTNRDGMPDRIMVRMTKQDLQNAPKFAKVGDNDSSTRPAGSGSGTGTGTGSAPRQ
jgi:hypothetical protein